MPRTLCRIRGCAWSIIELFSSSVRWSPSTYRWSSWWSRTPWPSRWVQWSIIFGFFSPAKVFPANNISRGAVFLFSPGTRRPRSVTRITVVVRMKIARNFWITQSWRRATKRFLGNVFAAYVRNGSGAVGGGCGGDEWTGWESAGGGRNDKLTFKGSRRREFHFNIYFITAFESFSLSGEHTNIVLMRPYKLHTYAVEYTRVCVCVSY